MSNLIKKLFIFLNQYSIDVATRPCCILFGMGIQLSIVIPLYYFALLFNSTLLVYWSDHLLDNKNIVLVQNSIRHTNIWKNKNILIGIGIGLFISNSWIAISYLKLTTLILGSVIVICMILYLFTHQKIRRVLILEKEILIAALYSISVCFVPFEILSRTTGSENLMLKCLLFCILIGCCALQNLLVVAVIEEESDKIAKAKNITHHFGKKQTVHLFLYLLLFQISLSMLTAIKFNDSPSIAMLILLLSISILQQVALYTRKRNQISNSYRYIGELAFWLTALMVFF